MSDRGASPPAPKTNADFRALLASGSRRAAGDGDADRKQRARPARPGRAKAGGDGGVKYR
jgi:hypothetical protein